MPLRPVERWNASITVDCLDPRLPPADEQGAAGVDQDLTRRATLSTGETIDGTKALRSRQGKMCCL